ncbi:SbcC/MukB-like Walker B domain-containing protein [Bacillus horti]|uniref:Nuclease SbcCD subunit C n=1 Tax=Caldalkalibacillus horti TaxID=77523 RepID=A0ABT9W3J0_9BACI|nr:AAA family ATPase [Bacillus horti]MDQ0167415.1 exonuclease SbcC [Bacillus horti]
MRPIHLSVAGLHSFREKQIVDFQVLCEGGVFGIFGPTGSGKSSLLDAMTLALYGKVERASNQIQGIINHAEKEVHVSFTFELGQGKLTERYCVERSYKKAGELSVRSAATRLLQVNLDSNETVVLADKVNDIQEKLHELIGLTFDDFSRAVVLPQGKFAEFLSLKGVERRQMLQRLFHLEQYGDQLNERLKHRVTSAKNRLNEILAEQQGVGEASKEALEQAEKHVQDVLKRIKQLSEQRNTFLQEFERLKSFRDWQEQLEKVEKGLEQLYQDEEEIHRVEEQLNRGLAAQQLKPYIEEYEIAGQTVEKWKAKKQVAQSDQDHAAREEAKHTELYEKLSKAKEEQQPLLLERRQLLRQGQELQRELGVKEKEKQELVQDELRVQEKRKAVQGEYEKQSKLLQLAKEKQKVIKEQMAGKNLPFEEKQAIQAGYQEFLKIAQVQQQLDGIQEEWAVGQKAIEELEAEHAQSILEQEQHLKKVGVAIKEIGEFEGRLKQLVAIGEMALGGKQQQMKQMEQKIEHVLAKEWMEQLVSGLQNGEACPICGSHTHPHPAEFGKEDIQVLRDRLAYEVSQQNQIRDYTQQARLVHHQFIELEEQLSSISFVKLEDVDDRANASNDVKGWNDEHGANDLGGVKKINLEIAATATSLKENVEDETVDLELFSTELAKSERFLRATKELVRLGREKAPSWNDAKMKSEAAKTGLKGLEAKQKSLMDKVQTMEQSWSSTFAKLELDKVEEQANRARELEGELYELQQRLDKSVPFIENTENGISELQQELNQIELRAGEQASLHKQLDQQITQMKQKLQELVGEQSIESLLVQAEKQLEELSESEGQARRQLEEARKARSKAENEFSVAQASLEQGEQRLEKAEKQLVEQLGESSFDKWQEAKEALVEKETLGEWKKRVDQYNEQVKELVKEKQSYLKKLGTNRISEEEWQDVLAKKQQLEQEYVQLVGQRGAAQKEYEAIKEKHMRFMQLEEERALVQHRVEQYGKLQSVFRGNSFVEYLAEEQLVYVCQDASSHLGRLTRQRYALEVDSQGGFVIRDDANGGVRRPVSTLSGGETFLTSLSLALALSAQIQLRGQYPLQFFFLDEGFGTLDPELLDGVVGALESLHLQQLAVGVISHVPELKERLPRKLVVTPAEFSGKGSSIHLETL